MSGAQTLRLGFVPLNDAAPILVAQARGLFAAEGLDVELSREVSWATVRDKLAVGALHAAHLLAPMALAMSLGVGSEPAQVIAPLALGLGGAAVTLSTRIAEASGGGERLGELVARRREQGASRLTFAVVYPYSIHALLLRAWLARHGVDPQAEVRITVAPPPRMAELLAGGVIEGFCAGEPWNAAAQAAGAGQVVARAAELWARAPDKVLGVGEAWAAANPETLQALLRALLRAAAWCEAPQNRAELAALLARPEHVGVAPELIAAGLAPIAFHRDQANAPLRGQAVWLLGEMARWGQLPPELDAAAIAARVYRSELYDQALRAAGA